ncbi:MAG: hypothetical protein ACI8RD_008199, partial [Bacillariaceae sp.]
RETEENTKIAEFDSSLTSFYETKNLPALHKSSTEYVFSFSVQSMMMHLSLSFVNF